MEEVTHPDLADILGTFTSTHRPAALEVATV
jgi:hypothetical protein